jgi:hypothetical protein
MQPPTWKEVGIPDIVVRTIKAMQPTYAMDCLISQLVCHNSKRLTLTYVCDRCGFQYIPERNTEEVSLCGNCQNKRVRCLQSLKFGNEKKIPYYTRQGQHILYIIRQMQTNFQNYFKSNPERDVDWEWHDNLYHVAFAGGDTAMGEWPRLAIARAALLTPYLWDSMHDWKNECKRDTCDQKLITQLLNHIAIRRE